MAIEKALKKNPEEIDSGYPFKEGGLEREYGLVPVEENLTEEGCEVVFKRKGYEVSTIRIDAGDNEAGEPRYIAQGVNKTE